MKKKKTIIISGKHDVPILYYYLESREKKFKTRMTYKVSYKMSSKTSFIITGV